MSLKRISPEEFKKRNLDRFGLTFVVYQAWIKKPAEYLEEKLAEPFLEEWWDGIGETKVAFFVDSEDIPFMLHCHKRNPIPNITIIETAYKCSVTEVTSVLHTISEVFQLSADEIVRNDIEGTTRPDLR